MKAFLGTLFIFLNCLCLSQAQGKFDLVKPERVYLHTDRNVYIAGDNLFYTLYIQGITGKTSKFAYLDIRDSHNSLVTNIQLEINNRIAFGNIYLSDTLHSDIYQIVCYTNIMRNEGEDTYFTKEIVIANRFDRKLEQFDSKFISDTSDYSHGHYSGNSGRNENIVIHLDKKVFDSREKVTFSIEPKDIPGDSITTVSVSVSELIPDISNGPSISDYFINNSKSTKTLEPGQYYSGFQPEIKGVEIQGRILPVKQSGNLSGISNEGILTDKKTNTILVSTPDSIANLQYTTTDSLGTFRFLLNRYYDGKEIIIRLEENGNAVIELDNKFKLIQPFFPSGKFRIPGIKSYLVRSMNVIEVQKNYTEKAVIDTIKVFEQTAAIPRVYYTPKFKVFPSDYIQLSDFMEVSRELLPTVKVRKNNDNYTLSFIDSQEKVSLNLNPAIFLDGVPIDDVNQIIKLGSNQIKCIESLPVIRYFGEMGLSGILAVFSKNMEINNIQFKTSAIRYQTLTSKKCTRPKPFKPTNNNKKIPEVRQLLLWDPEIILHNKENPIIEFYTSDLQGNYLISIQGITANGLPANGSAIIKVKSKSN